MLSLWQGRPHSKELSQCQNEDKVCNRCGKTGHLASQCGVPARAIDEDSSGEVIWGTCVIDEVQDVDAETEKRNR